MASDETPRVRLQDHEQLAFAGLARLLIRADGTFSSEESAALEAVALDLLGAPGPADSPYRSPAPEEVNPDAIWDLLDRALRELPEDESVKKAALAVIRPEARAAIFGALFEIASSDVIALEEWPLLDWLSAEWAVQSVKMVDG
jgi:uncharacterized tellurite resistance protein B-like protein